VNQTISHTAAAAAADPEDAAHTVSEHTESPAAAASASDPPTEHSREDTQNTYYRQMRERYVYIKIKTQTHRTLTIDRWRAREREICI